MNSVTLSQRKGEVDDGVDGSAAHGPLTVLSDAVHRFLAEARYHALAEGSAPNPDCTRRRDPDMCGTEPDRNPVLFAQERGDAEAIDRADVQQGGLRDCHFMAPLAALASTHEGREAIRNAIVENKNERGEVVSYTVTLHKPTHDGSLVPVEFTVDGLFSAAHASARTTDSGEHEVWPLVLEKAYAQYWGGYSVINGAGSPRRALEALTGKPAEETPLVGPQSYTPATLVSDRAAGKVLLLASGSFPPEGSHGLAEHHCYVISEVHHDGDKLLLSLVNPWNRQDRGVEVAFDELPRWFVAVDAGRVR